MLQLEKKEYDLSFLLNFEMLKEILIKLSKSQDKLENEIRNIHQFNSKRDSMIIELEKKVFNTTNHSDLIQNSLNEIKNNEEGKNIFDENNKGEKIIYNKFDTNENEFQNKELYNKGQSEILIDNNKNISYEKEKEIGKIEKGRNETKEIEQFNNINEKDNNQNFSPNKDNSEKKRIENKYEDNYINKSSSKNLNSLSNQIPSQDQKKQQTINGTIVSPDLISKIMKQLKEQQSKMNILENKLKSDSKNIKNLENQLKNHILDNESEIKLLDERINNILLKNEDYDQKLENLQVKTSELDVFSMFKDSGDGTIDATKLMIKSLEEKVFKKFELVDARYKKDSLDNLKIKSNMENITPKLDQFSRELGRISDINKQQKEELDNYKKENEENNLENFNTINNDINQKIRELNEDLKNNIKNKISLIEEQIKDIKINTKDMNSFDLLKLGLGNNGLDGEAAQALEKKINDLRKKMNDLENTLKLSMNGQELDSLKKEIKDIKLLIDKKITKDDLKELYNYHLSDVDEINDIKDRELMIHEELRKTIKDLQNIQQRMESINGNLALLQSNPTNVNTKIYDFSKYIDNQKLTETLKPILREFDKVYKEIDSFRRDLNEIDEQEKNLTKNSVNKLEEELNYKLNELKTFIQKKYLEKFEFNKTIKSIEVQIKSLNETPKKADADSWLLAKRPLKCFNCASCEANIKNDNYNTADYLPWKKYPRGEKIHRMGQGFSHMLQMMTSEFIKSIEKNDYPFDNELSSRNNNSNIIGTQYDKSTISGFRINNKEQFLDEDFTNTKKSKTKLPKVKQFSKAKIKKYEDNLPISDDEPIEKHLELNNDILTNNMSSPKILKITKKTKQNLGNKGNDNIHGNLMTMPGGFIQRNSDTRFPRNIILNTYDSPKN